MVKFAKVYQEDGEWKRKIIEVHHEQIQSIDEEDDRAGEYHIKSSVILKRGGCYPSTTPREKISEQMP